MCAAQEGRNTLTEHFSFAEITWKIENISIALCPSTLTIISNEFRSIGRDDILWRMSLNISHDRNIVGLYLKMLGPNEKFFCVTDEKPGLKVRCYANILDSNGEEPLNSERIFYFKYRDNIAIETFYLTDILTNLPHTGPDDLTIRCHILVDYSEMEDISVDVPLGIIELSETLEKLIKDPLYPDIKVLVNNGIFSINRDMLLNVDGLGKFLDERYKEAKLLNHCEYSIYSILKYAYSGNIKYILETPRIRVAEDIERFRVEELLAAYPKIRIHIGSTIEVERGSCDMEIHNFDTAEEPEHAFLNTDMMDTHWEICIYPKGRINGNLQEKKYVYVEATLLESIRPSIDVNIEFCSFGKNETKYSRRDHKRMKVGDKLGVPFFRRGGLLMRKLLIDRRFSLQTTVWIATGKINIHIEPIARPRPFPLTSCICMTLFSRKMGIILGTSNTWDLCLVSRKFPFHVHKFVVASRSPYFYNRMNDVYRQTHELPEYRKHYVRVFLEYLYTGLYCDIREDITFRMFEFGIHFQIRPLIVRFRDGLHFNTILEYLKCAVDKNLPYVYDQCLRHLISIGEQITNHHDWKRFSDERPNIVRDFVKYRR